MLSKIYMYVYIKRAIIWGYTSQNVEYPKLRSMLRLKAKTLEHKNGLCFRAVLDHFCMVLIIYHWLSVIIIIMSIYFPVARGRVCLSFSPLDGMYIS